MKNEELLDGAAISRENLDEIIGYLKKLGLPVSKCFFDDGFFSVESDFWIGNSCFGVKFKGEPCMVSMQIDASGFIWDMTDALDEIASERVFERLTKGMEGDEDLMDLDEDDTRIDLPVYKITRIQ